VPINLFIRSLYLSYIKTFFCVNVEFCGQPESTHDFLLSGLYKIYFLSPVNLWKLIKSKGTELICTSDISYKNSPKIN